LSVVDWQVQAPRVPQIGAFDGQSAFDWQGAQRPFTQRAPSQSPIAVDALHVFATQVPVEAVAESQ
jgi:hypothetical protein